MKLIDTHAHLQFERFDQDRQAVVEKISQELEAVINPGASLVSSEKAVLLCKTVENFYPAVGIHPHHENEATSDWLLKLENMVEKDKVVAVGEIGLDNHVYNGYPEPDLKRQTEVLLPQIDLAKKHNKPILFHCRKAYDELYEVIKGQKVEKALIHCFMGDKKTAKKFLDLGLLVSFAGNLTYKNSAEMREAAAYIPLESILVETDSPYLSPEPLRGGRNEPTNVHYVVKTIAEVKKTSTEAISSNTVANAKRFFSL